jgi:hypothetical protein
MSLSFNGRCSEAWGFAQTRKVLKMAKKFSGQKKVHLRSVETTLENTPATAPEAKVEDQKSAPASEGTAKKVKKPSKTVTNWRNLRPVKDEEMVAVIPGSVKRKSAATRFALYADGMNVGQYVEKSVQAGNAKALAQQDVRWDYVKGLITLDGVKYEA